MRKTSTNTKIAIGAGILLIGTVIFFVCNSVFNNTHAEATLLAPTATIASSATTTPATASATAPATKLYKYIQIHDACDWARVGTCVNMRSGPGIGYPVVTKLRNGVVLRTSDSDVVDGQTWYKIIFSAELSHPERVTGDLYVAGTESVTLFENVGDQYAAHAQASSTKRIVVSISKEMLYAYDGDALFMQSPISTGLEFTATPKGNFFILKKTPSRYMQGPPTDGSNDQYFDLPGVPWDMYFTNNGDVIHGAYWHDKFGQPWSHGCVNLSPDESQKLYTWTEIGTPVVVNE